MVRIVRTKEVFDRHHEVHKYEQSCLTQLTSEASHIGFTVEGTSIKSAGHLNDVTAVGILERSG